MKTTFTESQIVSILHQQEAGKSVKDICLEHGISAVTFYNWKAKYLGVQKSNLTQVRLSEEEINKIDGFTQLTCSEKEALSEFVYNIALVLYKSFKDESI